SLLTFYSTTLNWTTTFHSTRNNIGNLFGISDNEKILHRSKRGWMWNQFFLLEEYGGNDHQYVGKVRHQIHSVGGDRLCSMHAIL
uniref:Uncharacterized protein n=1 Tax=Periophthalmus magnuspinnatus TaxID=409849 RepID=A0A3B3ZIA1_9GOBI